MYTVPEQLSELAGTCLSASQGVLDAWTGAAGPLAALSGGVAGNTAGATAFLSAHTGASESADLVMGRFSGVLEQDMDDLYAVAFDMSTTDESTAAAYEKGAAGINGGRTPR